MRKVHRVYILLFVFLILALAGCTRPAVSSPSLGKGMAQTAQSPTERPVIPSATPLPTQEALAAMKAVQPTSKPAEVSPASEMPSWKADGFITEGEYAHETTIGDVRLWWRNDAEYLYIAFEGKTNGWVAVGLDPERRMKGANYLIGIITGGQTKVYDAYGMGEVGATHPADEELGGKNDIVAFAGVQEGGLTRFEVQVPLDSGDRYDKPLRPGGSYVVLAALSESAQFNASHSARSIGRITLDVTQ